MYVFFCIYLHHWHYNNIIFKNYIILNHLVGRDSVWINAQPMNTQILTPTRTVIIAGCAVWAVPFRRTGTTENQKRNMLSWVSYYIKIQWRNEKQITENYVKAPGVFTHVAPFWHPSGLPANIWHSFTSTAHVGPCGEWCAGQHLNANVYMEETQI